MESAVASPDDVREMRADLRELRIAQGRQASSREVGIVLGTQGIIVALGAAGWWYLNGQLADLSVRLAKIEATLEVLLRVGG